MSSAENFIQTAKILTCHDSKLYQSDHILPLQNTFNSLHAG